MKKFREKIDKITWFLISFMPFIIYCFVSFNSHTFDISNLLDILPSSGFIYNIFETIFNDYFGFTNSLLLSTLSYLSYVEFAHIFYDILVFIPRFCHKFIGGFIDNE